MSNASNMARLVKSLEGFAEQNLSPKAAAALLAKTAITERDRLIRSGATVSSFYTTYVDGRRNAPEWTVSPTGQIRYVFNLLGLAATFALGYCLTRSPRRSGRFRGSWAVTVNGQPWKGDLNTIPAGAEVMIINPQPYARKIEMGSMQMRVPPGIVEGARQATKKQYPTLDVSRIFASIPAGVLPPAPWILRNVAGHRRPDRVAGQPVLYPAVLIKEKT